MALSETMKRLQELATRTDLKPFEDAWVEQISTDPSDVDGFLKAISGLESQGQFGKAGQYLNLLLPSYTESGNDDAALKVLKRLAKVAPRERGIPAPQRHREDRNAHPRTPSAP